MMVRRVPQMLKKSNLRKQIFKCKQQAIRSKGYQLNSNSKYPNLTLCSTFWFCFVLVFFFFSVFTRFLIHDTRLRYTNTKERSIRLSRPNLRRTTQLSFSETVYAFNGFADPKK